MAYATVVLGGENLVPILTDFINSWPLYTPKRIVFEPPNPTPVSLPNAILRYCAVCSATPTWERSATHTAGEESIDVGYGYLMSYTCTHCLKATLRLWYRIDQSLIPQTTISPAGVREAVLSKFGQVPAQQINPAPEVEKGLPDASVPLYKKGLTSLSQGYGLGALGYLRRVVEDTANHLIDVFADRAKGLGETQAAEEIRKAKESDRMEDRLKAAALSLPVILRPGGVNPLSAIYNHYSRGIHGLTDEECLDIARRLQSSLDYVFRNWRLQMEEADAFRDQIQQWTDPKVVPKPGD
jgi:hypothetical protein